MPSNRMHVRPLLTAAEFELFEASVGDGLKALTGAQLRGKIKRTRSLRDKNVDLLRRQKVASRSRTGNKGGTSGIANERTARKATVFAEVLQRFEQRLEQQEAAQARREAREQAASAKADAAKKRATTTRSARGPQTAAGPKAPSKPPARARGALTASAGEGARAARQKMQLQGARSKPIQAHVASRGRRTQARRDSRG
jgi:hypothetical protein